MAAALYRIGGRDSTERSFNALTLVAKQNRASRLDRDAPPDPLVFKIQPLNNGRMVPARSICTDHRKTPTQYG